MSAITNAAGGAGSGKPAGSDKQVQFNDAGSFQGVAGFTFDKATGLFLVPTAIGVGATPGAVGALRIANGATINARNVGNTGDLELVGSWTDNKVYVGGTANDQGLVLRSAAGMVEVAGGRLKFPATQQPSADWSVLDDYREGTFSPTFTGSGGASGQTYNTQIGNYQKIGRKVLISVNLIIGTVGTISGTLRLGNLPFLSDNYYPLAVTFFTGLGGTVAGLGAYTRMNDTVAELNYLPAAGGPAMLAMSQSSLAAGSQMLITGWYFSNN